MKQPQARSCSNGHHADWVGEVRRGRGAESNRGRKKGVFCPGSSRTAQTGKMTHYFSVLSFKDFFFCWFCFVFLKKP